jgi:MFS transporter, NNP family, nitrate/nitrite transporter
MKARCPLPAAGDLPEGTGLRTRLGVVLFLTALFYLNFLARILPAPLMPVIETDLEIGHGGAGSLFLLISAGYFVALAGSGFVSARIQHRRTVALSAGLMGLALVGTALCQSLAAIRMGLVLTGFAAGLYLPSGVATLTTLIHPRDWGKAISVHELAPNLAFATAPLVAELLLAFFTWRTAFAVVGGLSLAIGLAFLIQGPGGDLPGERPAFRVLRDLAAQPAFWLLMLLFSLGISSTLGLYTMLPLYLVAERGLEQGWANSLVAFSRMATIPTALLGGWAADRFGAGRTIGTVLLVSGGLTALLGLAAARWVPLLVILQPLLAVCFFPAGLAALSAIGPPGGRNVVVSMTIPTAFLIGGGLTPTFIGMMGSHARFGLGIALLGGALIAGGLLALRVQLPGRHDGR